MVGSQQDYSRVGRPGSEEIESLKVVGSQANCIQVGRPGSEEILRQEQSWWELRSQLHWFLMDPKPRDEKGTRSSSRDPLQE